VCACVCVCVWSAHLAEVNMLSVGATNRLDDGRPQSEAVEQQRQTSHDEHDQPRSTWSTQHVSLQRKLYRQVALERETNDEPDRQETGHVYRVAEQLTPAALVVHLQQLSQPVIIEKKQKGRAVTGNHRARCGALV